MFAPINAQCEHPCARTKTQVLPAGVASRDQGRRYSLIHVLVQQCERRPRCIISLPCTPSPHLQELQLQHTIDTHHLKNDHVCSVRKQAFPAGSGARDVWVQRLCRVGLRLDRRRRVLPLREQDAATKPASPRYAGPLLVRPAVSLNVPEPASDAFSVLKTPHRVIAQT